MEKKPQKICPECKSGNTIYTYTTCINTVSMKCIECGFAGYVTIRKVEVDIPTNENNAVCVESRNTLEAQGKKERYKRLVLDYIKKQGAMGATCKEIEDALNMAHETASCTITFLTKAKYGYGLLRDSGRRRENPKSGRKNTVYEIAT